MKSRKTKIQAGGAIKALTLLGTTVLLHAGGAFAATPTPTPEDEEKWKTFFSIGAQLTPDYQENGRNAGLKKMQLFAQMVWDGKFGCDSRKGDCKLFGGSVPYHTGVSVTLLGTAVSRKAEEDPTFTPKEFDDVAQTVVASGHLFAPFAQSKGGTDSLGPIVRASAISRDTLKSSGDSVGWVYSLGLQYASEDYRATSKNGIPGGYIRMSAARFEDYGGLGKRTRLVIDAAARLDRQNPTLGIYIGIMGNFGKGPDELGLVFTFVRKPSEMMSFFMLGKEKEEKPAASGATTPPAAPAPAGAAPTV